MPLDVEVEVARPHERQHGARETADEAHEEGEMGNHYRQDGGEQNKSQPQGHRPNL